MIQLVKVIGKCGCEVCLDVEQLQGVYWGTGRFKDGSEYTVTSTGAVPFKFCPECGRKLEE